MTTTSTTAGLTAGAFAVTLALGACSGGSDTSSAPASGVPDSGAPDSGVFPSPEAVSGRIAIGTVTGFGSVFVNGVRYATDRTAFTVDETAGSESDLAIGMVVRITGTVDADGVNGTAESIEYDAELEGPVAAAPVADAAGETRRFTVLGTTVVVDSIGTVFDADADAGFGFETIGADDVVEVSGFYDPASDTLYASRVEKEGSFDAADPDATEAELEGVVGNLDAAAMTFELGSVSVRYDADTELPDDGLADGQRVEVEGTLLDATTIRAAEIEIEDDDYPDDVEEAEIQGLVTAFTDLGDFSVGGQAVDASGENVEFEPAGLAGALSAGMRIEVEGPIVGGVLLAEEVTDRDGDVELRAFVSAADTAAGTLSLEAAPGQIVVVSIDPLSTRFEDDGDAGPRFGLADIVAGDYLEIEARAFDDTVVAGSVQREEADEEGELEIEAPVEAFDATAGTVTLLGVTFGTDGDTEFEIDDVESASAAAFFAALEVGTVVAVSDESPAGMTTGDGIAEEIEIED